MADCFPINSPSPSKTAENSRKPAHAGTMHTHTGEALPGNNLGSWFTNVDGWTEHW